MPALVEHDFLDCHWAAFIFIFFVSELLCILYIIIIYYINKIFSCEGRRYYLYEINRGWKSTEFSEKSSTIILPDSKRFAVDFAFNFRKIVGGRAARNRKWILPVGNIMTESRWHVGIDYITEPSSNFVKNLVIYCSITD